MYNGPNTYQYITASRPLTSLPELQSVSTTLAAVVGTGLPWWTEAGPVGEQMKWCQQSYYHSTACWHNQLLINTTHVGMYRCAKCLCYMVTVQCAPTSSRSTAAATRSLISSGTAASYSSRSRRGRSSSSMRAASSAARRSASSRCGSGMYHMCC